MGILRSTTTALKIKSGPLLLAEETGCSLGAQASANLYSLIETAKANGLKMQMVGTIVMLMCHLRAMTV